MPSKFGDFVKVVSSSIGLGWEPEILYFQQVSEITQSGSILEDISKLGRILQHLVSRKLKVTYVRFEF